MHFISDELMNSPHQVVAAPKGLANRSFAVDGKELVKALSKAVYHGLQTKWEDAASDVLDAISAVGLGMDVPALAYVLIRKAATTAMFAIVGESRKSNLIGIKPYEGAIEDALKDLLVEHEILISDEFFAKPAELPIVKAFQALLDRWLTLLEVEQHMVKSITDRFPSYFLYSLSEEWRKASSLYEPILKSVRENPFGPAGEQDFGWESYASLLQRRVDESLYDEAFSLRQIYVPLRAYYEDVDYRKIELDGRDRRARVRTVVDLRQELMEWLDTCDLDDAVRVISGGPGSGKSSFAKVFAAELAVAHKRKVLFIPLHLIDPSRDLVGEVGRFVSLEGILPQNPLDAEHGESKLLIIFDGLDELANQGKAANETARLFTGEVTKIANLRNSHKLRLQVIISGRELTVQGNESEFRKPHQILNLLSYLLSAEDTRTSESRQIIDKHEIMATDQRAIWWQQYGTLTGNGYDGLPAPLATKDLEEITAQPLLNYLVALSYTRKKLDFTKSVNRNQVYADLVNAVYERAYEKNRTHESIRHIRQEDFLRILEVIGLAAWHGDGRTTTVYEITKHCDAGGLSKILADFKEGAEAGVIRLLTAFFFRQHDQNAKGDQTFEFTHKSFGEYLAAQRIMREMESIVVAREARAKNPSRGASESAVLGDWIRLASANALTEYLARFIGAELELRKERFARRVQLCFAELFSFVLAAGMPVEAMGGSFKEMCFLTRNAEEALLVCLSLCARVTRKVSDIKHPDAYSFGAWFRRVQGQRKGAVSILAAAHLDYLNLERLTLDMIDFFDVDLSYSILAGSLFHYATLSRSLLMETDMRGVHLRRCHFDGTHFYKTDLSGATLAGNLMQGADFLSAKFESTSLLDGRQFSEANVENCDFSKAHFANDSTRTYITELIAAQKARSKENDARMRAEVEAAQRRQTK